MKVVFRKMYVNRPYEVPVLGLNLPVDVCAQAKCEYCGLYGALGRCAGCGAPNQPVQFSKPRPPEFDRVRW